MVNPENNFSAISKDQSWRIFDQIAPKYDLLNRILSIGRDLTWRRKLVKFLPPKDDLDVLDLATGTADVPITLLKSSRRIKAIQGIDLSEEMLTIGRRKINEVGFGAVISLKTGDANRIPYPQNSFDVVTMSFGIRNIVNVPKVLGEIFDVLRPQGRALILEFSMPQNTIVRAGYLFYLRHIVPAIGFMFAGNYKAYRYLNETIETFPSGKTFCQLMKNRGFQNVKANTLMLGIATIYQGDKP